MLVDSDVVWKSTTTKRNTATMAISEMKSNGTAEDRFNTAVRTMANIDLSRRATNEVVEFSGSIRIEQSAEGRMLKRNAASLSEAESLIGENRPFEFEIVYTPTGRETGYKLAVSNRNSFHARMQQSKPAVSDSRGRAASKREVVGRLGQRARPREPPRLRQLLFL